MCGSGGTVLGAKMDGIGKTVNVGEVVEVLYMAHAGPVVPYP